MRDNVVPSDARPDKGRQRLERKVTEDARLLYSSLAQSVLLDRPWQMDANFLEFWGNLLISLTRGQKQIDDMIRWVRQSFPGADDLTNLFKKTYGLNQPAQAPSGQAELWKETRATFHQSYGEYLKLLDVVPRADYEKLEKENDSLKRKIVELEGVVGNLRALLAGKIQTVPGAAVDEFQTGFLNYLEKLQQLISSFADVSEGTSVKETDQSVVAESDIRVRPPLASGIFMDVGGGR